MRCWLGVATIVLAGCACEEEVIAPPKTTSVALTAIDPGAVVIGRLDFRAPAQGDSAALAELNRRALALGADTVVGAQITHDDDEVRVTGIAIRRTGEPTTGQFVATELPSSDDEASATVPMYDDSTGPQGAPPPPFDRAECPQCYVSTRFSSRSRSFWGW